MKIAIIGAGNMGGAIALGFARGGVVVPEEITVSARTEKTLQGLTGQEPLLHVTQDNAQAVRGADLVILAVKPWLLEEVVAGIRAELDYTHQRVASVVAGVTFDRLSQMLDNGSGVEPVLYRIIPNTAISQGESVTFIAAHGATQTEIDHLVSLFAPLGLTLVVDQEQMVAGTSLASCGIAFALKYLDASITGGVSLGFTPEQSRAVVMQTMVGALQLLRANATMPQTEIDRVTTPGGITLKGLAAMQENEFEQAVWAGLEKSR